MTIKRQLFFSNIRMVLVTIGGIMAAFMAVRIVMVDLPHGAWRFREHSNFESFRSPGSGAFFLLVFLAVFVAFICIINSILSYRMAKRITKPLDVLTRGVRHIHGNNFAYRIEYDGDDEYSPVCEAFNQMAAQLQASAERRIKDEANRRELLAGISHDLRTPLTTINGYLDGLESGVASTLKMQEKYFTVIKSNAVNMKQIIEQLFLFSKLDMDDFSFSPRRFDIKRAISDMVEELVEEYAMKGLVISVSGTSTNVFVNVDATHLRRVLVNILENSAQYKEKETGCMEISVSHENNFVCLRFADDGPGLSPDILPNLFNAFYRADPSRHTKGSGLGLAISAKIIERSGGTIHAENNDSGGLAIVIRLPAETGEA